MRKFVPKLVLGARIGLFLLIVMTSAGATNAADYFYDSLGRLEQVQYPDGTSLRYAYDNVGNRLQREVVQRLENLTASPPSPRPSGTPVTFTPSIASGGPYEFRYWLHDGTQWTLARDYATTPSWIWETQGVPAGIRFVQVEIRTVGSTGEREGFRVIPYEIVAGIGTVTLNVLPQGPTYVGDNLTCASSVSGEAGNLLYQYWTRRPGEGWSIARAYSSDNSWVWNTSSAIPDTYSIVTGVKENRPGALEVFSLPVVHELVSRTVTDVHVAASPASQVPYDTPVVFSATAKGGMMPLQYRFRLCSFSAGCQTIREYGGVGSWIWDNAAAYGAGSYTVEVSARSDGSALDNEAVGTLQHLVVVPPVDNVTFAVSPDSPSNSGTLVTVTASASGGVSPQYSFYVVGSDGVAYFSSGGYVSSNTFAWDTTGRGPSEWTIHVDARSTGSFNSREATASLPYRIVIPPITAVTLSVSPPGQAIRGNAVGLTAAATGGLDPYKTYKFTIRNADGTAVVDNFYGGLSTLSWETWMLPVGTYTLEVRARGTGSALDNEAFASQAYQLYIPPVDNVTLSASPASPLPAGPSVTFTANASGGLAPYSYRFRIRNPGGAVVASGSYLAQNTFGWNTAGLSPGIYSAEVCALSSGSTLDNEAVASLAYQLLVPVVSSVSVSSTYPSPLVLGPNVTFTATATGGLAPIKYRCIIRNSGGTAVCTWDYGTASSWVWSTGYNTSGSYTVEVSARSNGSTADYEARSTVSYVLRPKVTFISVAPSPYSAQSPGVAITLTSSTGGGYSPVQYRTRLLNAGGAQVALFDYDQNPGKVWNSTGFAYGNYTAVACAKSSGSVMDNDVCTSYPYKLQAPVTSVSVSTSPSGSTNRGTPVVISASGTGGVAPIQYQFTVKNASGVKVVDRTYSSSTSYYWETWMLSTGSYTIEVRAKGSGSGADYEAIGTQSYRLN